MLNDFFISLMLLGAFSSNDASMPFWMTANQYGMMPEHSGALGVLSAGSEFDESKTFQVRWGASMGINEYENALAPSAAKCNAMLDQLYGSLRWSKFTIDLGQKHRENMFMGASEALGSLSTTGGHLVETGNARSMPGYRISMDPVAVPWTNKRFWIFGEYGDFSTTDNRYVKGALVHRTLIGFRLTPGERLKLDAILDHYAVWGGTSPDYGDMGVNLDNYFRMVTGRHAGASGTRNDQLNVIGDQGGSEIFRASYKGDGWDIIAQHDIPYNDGSGMGFQNFPDGVNTLCFSWEDKDRWITDVLYEYHYTMYQSGPIHQEIFDEDGNSLTPKGVSTTGMDNYFSNGEYKSCWTHYGRVIGDPLILPNGVHEGMWTSARTNKGIENNRYKAHHIGLGGRLFKKHPYKLMLTYSNNFGTYHKSYLGENPAQKPWGTVLETGLHQLSAAFMGSFNSIFGLNGLSFMYGLYLDQGELYQDSFGTIIGIKYLLGE